MKNKLIFALRIIFGIALVLFLVMKSDTKAMLLALQEVDKPLLMQAFIFSFLALIVSVIKWQVIIKLYKINVSFKKLLYIYWSSVFFNNFLPTMIGGDIYRVTATSKHIKSRLHSLVTVFLDRYTGAISLALISLISILFTLKILGSSAKVLIVFIGMTVGFSAAIFNERFMNLFDLVLGKLFKNSTEKSEIIREGLYEFKTNKHTLFITLLLSILFQLLYVSAYWSVGRALGFDINYVYYLAFIPVITLASMIPVSINGVGIREATTVALFKSTGLLNRSDALLLSLTLFAVVLVLSLFGCLTYLFPCDNKELNEKA